MPSALFRHMLSVPVVGDLAATLQGWRVSRRRYGALYQRLLPQIEARARLGAEALREACEARLRLLIAHAALHVPWYRRQFHDAQLQPDHIRTFEDLRRLPLLAKESLRADPAAFLDERLPAGAFQRLSTSGTSGTPLELLRTAEAEQTSYAFFEARCRRPAGMEFGRLPYVMMGGQLVAAIGRTRPPFWCYNRAWKQLYLSSYHLSDRFLPAYVAELRRRPYHAILGYPSSLYAVARHILDSGETPFHFRCAITSSEVLLDHQREAIARAFGCRVVDQYGAGELCVFAAECGHGSVHVSPDYGWVEVVDDDGRPAPPGQVGELVCTSLINFGQVFIRYRIQDRGRWSDGRCACGSALPVMERLEGRCDAVLVTADGRRIGRLDPVFKGVAHVRECQIVQESTSAFVVRVVAAEGFDASDAETIRRNLADRVGRADIRVETVASIERTSAGKFQAVISRVGQG